MQAEVNTLKIELKVGSAGGTQGIRDSQQSGIDYTASMHVRRILSLNVTKDEGIDPSKSNRAFDHRSESLFKIFLWNCSLQRSDHRVLTFNIQSSKVCHLTSPTQNEHSNHNSDPVKNVPKDCA